jgi:3-deoxy-D-arabino-heptulosonate 7-phosphate (DAHP) synthase class II
VAVTPSPDGVGAMIAWMRQQSDVAGSAGGTGSARIGTRLSATLPAWRLTLVNGDPETTGENNAAHPTIQVEAWANDPAAADLMMRTFTAALPLIRWGTWAGTYVSGAYVDLGPIMSDDPDLSSYRQLVDVILDVHNP